MSQGSHIRDWICVFFFAFKHPVISLTFFQKRARNRNPLDRNLFLLPQLAKFLSCMSPTFDISIQSYFQLGIKFNFYFRDISRERERVNRIIKTFLNNAVCLLYHYLKYRPRSNQRVEPSYYKFVYSVVNQALSI